MATTTSDSTPTPERALTGHLWLTASVILAVIGVMAFVAGVTDRWIIEPVGDAFGELSPGWKSLVATAVVAATIATIAAARWRHSREVQAARRVIEAAAEPPQAQQPTASQ